MIVREIEPGLRIIGNTYGSLPIFMLETLDN